MVSSEENHLLKINKCLNEGSKNMVLTTEDLKKPGQEIDKSNDHTV